MEVAILCGGKGTRMRDVATDIPKPMVPIGGKPILWHIMKGFAQHGFKKFILCLGYKGWVIKRYFADYYMANCDLTVNLASPEATTFHNFNADENWEVTLADTGEESMTAYRIRAIEKYVTGKELFVTYGDGIGNVDITQLLNFHRSHNKTATVTAVRPPGRFGEMVIDNHQVNNFVEKPQISSGSINGGFFVFNRSFFSHLQDDPTITLESGPLTSLANQGELMAYEHNGFWQPVDNARDYKFVNDLWDQGNAPWKTWDQPNRLRLAG
ncbi:Glucose-1-phosphate cytidylyltransferase [Planctomycetales bacterium 10988]|nr:Glucose-1-phosphate cytidylyltransferase [Planctomycetales bacterium 10988]